MSWQPAPDPLCDKAAADLIETVIVPRTRDLGRVRGAARPALGTAADGRARSSSSTRWGRPVPAGHGLDVRPHPHIGLATVTYLFDGEILHRDSLGTRAADPAGRRQLDDGRARHRPFRAHAPRGPRAPAAGCSASSPGWRCRRPPRRRRRPSSITRATRCRCIEGEGRRVRLIAGRSAAQARRSPTLAAMFYADAVLRPGAELPLPAEHEERAVYVVRGRRSRWPATAFAAGQLLVFRPGDAITLPAPSPAACMLLGGEPMDGPRHIWWNFVSSSHERIEQAKADWRAGRFGAVPGETEFIPLPDR